MALKNNTADVIIIGLGAMGSASSYYLSNEGVSVLGFDTYDPPHKLGSSHGHTRVIREAYHEGISYVPIVQRAYELWHEIQNYSSKKIIMEFGGLYLGSDGNYIKDAKLSAEKYKIPISELNYQEIIDKFRVLNPPENFQGLLEFRSGAVFPENSIEYFLENSKSNGVRHKINEKVLSWEKSSDSYKVITNKGTYFSEKIIFSSGAWIKNLLPQVNIPVKIERQVLLWFEPKKNRELFLSDSLTNTGWDLENGLEFYTQPIIENKGFKVAMHHNGENISSDNLLREFNQNDEDIIRGFLEEYIPLANGELIESRVCIYTNSPDYDFIIDFHPDDNNIVICSPCSGHGFKFTPAIGEICSNMILGKKVQYDLSEFSIDRFL
ncbi:MAG: N-methyl-L-tryptophan oxidase [Dehalococcoidia bacterium]|nr:N-methyl-L-tryptophan oxidase [Dehalococcoidia bacterium]|tara:strand:- start:8459 stop:9598 length:1140 start_codon:yes stop_codon:yes gene_type:complete